MTPRLGALILPCTSFRFHASSFRLLLLRLCSNRSAEALVVSEILNRLAFVLRGLAAENNNNNNNNNGNVIRREPMPLRLVMNLKLTLFLRT